MFTFDSISWMLHVHCTMYMGDLQDSFCQWSLNTAHFYTWARALSMPLTNLHLFCPPFSYILSIFLKNSWRPTMYHDVMNPKPSMGYHPNSQVQKANKS